MSTSVTTLAHRAPAAGGPAWGRSAAGWSFDGEAERGPAAAPSACGWAAAALQ
ncbi:MULTISPECIES: hypothetical protein [Subtercola]|uniref:hypothetical protein n=1 Tax=Subtercola TaxID=120212 RepID=UPI00137624DD|nr:MULTISPECIES: hypothetical protein [Subtercola]MEA9986447.1 hypothetical protein [Subtercola sp. RTI3]